MEKRVPPGDDHPPNADRQVALVSRCAVFGMGGAIEKHGLCGLQGVGALFQATKEDETVVQPAVPPASAPAT